MAIAVFLLRSHVGLQHRINAGLVAFLTLGLEMVEHRFLDPQGYVLGSVRLNQLGVGPEICIGFGDIAVVDSLVLDGHNLLLALARDGHSKPSIHGGSLCGRRSADFVAGFGVNDNENGVGR